MGTIVDDVAEQLVCSYEEALQYLDDLEAMKVIERAMPDAPWQLGAWLLDLDGKRWNFLGPLADIQ